MQNMFLLFILYSLLSSSLPTSQPLSSLQHDDPSLVPDLQNQHSMPVQPLSTLKKKTKKKLVSVNKIHFHRFVCPVLYTCSKKIIK